MGKTVSLIVVGSAKLLKERLEGKILEILSARLRLSFALPWVVFKAWSLMSESEPKAENRQKRDHRQNPDPQQGPANTSRAH